MEFLVFIMIVTILLINLLIAMMGNTYGCINYTIFLYTENIYIEWVSKKNEQVDTEYVYISLLSGYIHT